MGAVLPHITTNQSIVKFIVHLPLRMKESLLLRMWEAMPPDSRHFAGQVLRSPLFNQREELLRLLQFLEEHAAKGTTSAALSKEKAWRYLYSHGEPYRDTRMRLLMADLLALLRESIALAGWIGDTAASRLPYWRQLRQFALPELLDRELVRLRKAQDRDPRRDTGYFEERYAFEQEVFQYTRQQRRLGEDNTPAVREAFAVWVALESLQQGCAQLAQQSVTARVTDIPYLAETLRMVDEGAFAEQPAVATWHAAYQSLSAPEDVGRFAAFKQALQAHGGLFGPSDQRDLYILAVNVCIRRINAGDLAFVREAFALYRDGLTKKVFIENGYLSRFTYRNVLNIALALEEWDYARQHLDTFREYLHPQTRDNTWAYNLATWHFRRKEYDAAQELLRGVELPEMLENFDGRRMLAIIYYETDAIQALDALLDSFDIYLRRHKEGGYHRLMYLHFVRYLKAIVAHPFRSVASTEKLRSRIADTEYVADREWLLSQL
jgi:hypothetical protein